MKDSVQVVINLDEVHRCRTKLDLLSRRTANRTVKVQFTDAKGKVADEMVQTAAELNEIGAALSSLVAKTEKAMLKAEQHFEEMDQTAADFFNASEG